MNMLHLPFRIGATSYVIEDDLLPNAHFLADKVQDMQLVLFDLPGGPSNLPTPETVAALTDVGRQRGLTYTVHLIADIGGKDDDSLIHPSWVQAHQVITLTQPLRPWAYILHLEGRNVRGANTPLSLLTQWQTQQIEALQAVAAWAGNPALLAVENLEGYPPEFVTPLVAQLPVSRCLDIGHLWLDGHDPLPYLQRALPHTRVIHLHGLYQGRDHQSLIHTEPARLDPIIALLIREQYQGVLTLEVFGEEDFMSSLDALMRSIKRLIGGL